jgi:hypothetical protein
MSASGRSETIWFGECKWEGNIEMKNGLQRTRAREWAAVYLRLFGPGEANTVGQKPVHRLAEESAAVMDSATKYVQILLTDSITTATVRTIRM